MLLDNKQQEFDSLIKQYLRVPINGGVYFGIDKGDGLRAVASLKCYMGHWYMRGCVVKPEFRGQGLQQQLIQERLQYLRTEKPDVSCVRAAIYPDNQFSINNVLGEGFVFEKHKKMNDGIIANVYKKMLKEVKK